MVEGVWTMVAYLTKREKEVLDYIKDFYTRHGFAPSLDEIRIGLGLSSVSTVHEHIAKLTNKGYLARHPNKARSFQLKQPGESLELPITTLQALSDPLKQIPLGKLDMSGVSGTDSGAVAAQVQGNYLVQAGIFDGDYLIVIPGNGLMDGDLMAGLVDGFKPVIGRLYHFGTKAIVKPIASDRDSLVVDNDHLVVIGRVKAVIRKF